MTKVSGSLPKGEGDGLSQFGTRFVNYPGQPVVVVAVLDVHKITTDLDSGTKEATLRIDMVERVLPEDLDLAKSIIRGAKERRSGFQDDKLPLDLADELDQVFDAAAEDPRSVAEQIEATVRDLNRAGVSVEVHAGEDSEDADGKGKARRGSRGKRGGGDD